MIFARDYSFSKTVFMDKSKLLFGNVVFFANLAGLAGRHGSKAYRPNSCSGSAPRFN